MSGKKHHKPTRAHKATKQQQRDRARRRALRREETAGARQQKQRTQWIVIAGVALTVIVGVFVLNSVLGSDSDPGTASTPTGSPTAVATAQATSTPQAPALPENCTAPPPAPGAAAPFDLPDPATAAGKQFEAIVTTNCGEITVDLDGARAPQTVASFLQLAEGSFYNDSPCHRLLTSGNIVLQCGDPTGLGTGGPGYGYGIEEVPADGHYPRGTLAMARTGDLERGTGSQFFIVNQDSTWSPSGGGYTIFGNVTSGMEIVDQVVAAGVLGGGTEGSPALPLSILSVAVNEK
ncbi:MAG: peptidylprolyl isomerase [Actinomycetia bacterium]|nr:peptidylprolyl isomerase [Actinomycetes bacterium]